MRVKTTGVAPALLKPNECPSSPSSRTVTNDAPGGHQPWTHAQGPAPSLPVRPAWESCAALPCATRHHYRSCHRLDQRLAPPRKATRCTWCPGGLQGGQAPKKRVPFWMMASQAPLWKIQMSDTRSRIEAGRPDRAPESGKGSS